MDSDVVQKAAEVQSEAERRIIEMRKRLAVSNRKYNTYAKPAGKAAAS